jgi:hypothetical protein
MGDFLRPIAHMQWQGNAASSFKSAMQREGFLSARLTGDLHSMASLLRGAAQEIRAEIDRRRREREARERREREERERRERDAPAATAPR